MAQLIINTPTDGDAVWLWELCKKLGYGVEAVHFGDCPLPDWNSGDVVLEKEKVYGKGAGREPVLYARNFGKNQHCRKESNHIIKKITKL
ncbi:hypothetical protein VB264_05180 [Arcicella aquatica]|uniref:Uncharacterized protein n=1 Tax=Arcicella aquatica TaxID=217141 RepID=A0ABU5QK97_9BACT|nr:hypothetical protein [Arcicella aquatica]MEA5257169.1 hypothetical protein [Arcicella aquatica]